MKEIDKARKDAIRIINNSDEFIVLTPEEGAKTYCELATMLGLITGYLCMQKQEGYIDDEIIDEVHRLAKLSQKDIEKEVNNSMKQDLKEILKSNEDFMDFIKDLIGE